MNLESCVTLHAWKYNNDKYVICVIKIEKRAKFYYQQQQKPHFTYHWLQPEHWAAFESKLSELVTSSTLKYFTKTLRFNLIDSIRLSISRTSIPIDSLCETIKDIGVVRKKDVIAAIECKFEHLEQCVEELSPFKELHCDYRYERNEEKEKTPCKKHHSSNQEDGKDTVTPRNHDYGNDDIDKKLLRKENEISSAVNLQVDQESPKHLTPHKDKPNRLLTIPSGEEEDSQDFVTPHKLRRCSNSEASHKKQVTTRKKQDTKQKIDQVEDSNKQLDDQLHIIASKPMPNKSLVTSKKPHKRNKRDEKNSNSEEESNKSGKRKKYTEEIPSSSESSDDSCEEKNRDRALSVLNRNSKELKKSNPSNREISLENSTKNNAIVSSPEKSNKERMKFNLPKLTLVSPPISSKRKLRKKIDIKSPATQQNQTINKFLSKKNDEKIKEKTKQNDVGKKLTDFNLISSDSELAKVQKSDSINSSQEKGEIQMNKLENRKEYNREVSKILKDLIPKTPKKIKNLDLMELKTKEILNTFDKYQPQLENLFQEFKSKSKPKHKNGVDHFLVMGLLSDSAQLEMMNALSERYEKHREGLPKYGELFSMVLMPEWILCVFMKRHNLTRQAAIEHIKAQNAYKVYSQSEVQIDESIMF